jgi:hypothetical protein
MGAIRSRKIRKGLSQGNDAALQPLASQLTRFGPENGPVQILHSVKLAIKEVVPKVGVCVETILDQRARRQKPRRQELRHTCC